MNPYQTKRINFTLTQTMGKGLLCVKAPLVIGQKVIIRVSVRICPSAHLSFSNGLWFSFLALLLSNKRLHNHLISEDKDQIIQISL